MGFFQFKSFLASALFLVIIGACSTEPIKVPDQQADTRIRNNPYGVDPTDPPDPSSPVNPSNPPVDPSNPPVNPSNPPVTPSNPPVTPSNPPVVPRGPYDGTKECFNFTAPVCDPGIAKPITIAGTTSSYISGFIYVDANKSGTREVGEPGLDMSHSSLARPYVDINKNCVYDSGTDKLAAANPNSNGGYSIAGPFDTGEVIVRMQSFFPHYSTDGYIAHKIQYTANQYLQNVNFPMAEHFLYSTGKAPASYGVASHKLNNYWFLGSKWVANAAAATCNASDGVRFPTNMKFGTNNNNVVFNVSRSGLMIRMWIDFNADGDFDDPGEPVVLKLPPSTAVTQIATNAGDNTWSFDIPVAAGTVTTNSITTWARVRLGNNGSLTGPAGESAMGEVEDYQITISK